MIICAGLPSLICSLMLHCGKHWKVSRINSAKNWSKENEY